MINEQIHKYIQDNKEQILKDYVLFTVRNHRHLQFIPTTTAFTVSDAAPEEIR